MTVSYVPGSSDSGLDQWGVTSRVCASRKRRWGARESWHDHIEIQIRVGLYLPVEDITVCGKVTPVILHGVVSLETRRFESARPESGPDCVT